MQKKKEVEIPVDKDVALHFEFFEGDAEENLVVPVEVKEIADCGVCLFGPPDRRAFTECESAMRRGNTLGCTRFQRKI